MKAVRILQILVLVALAVYFVMLHAANPTRVDLLVFFPLPPALVIAIALVVGWLIGWVPGRVTAWRRAREVERLRNRVAELEQHVPSFGRAPEQTPPVIPDRMPATEDPDRARGSE